MSFIDPNLIIISTLTIWIPALAPTKDPYVPEPLVLNEEQGEYLAGLHLKILEDPSGKLTIDRPKGWACALKRRCLRLTSSPQKHRSIT